MKSKKWQWLIVVGGLLLAARQGTSVWRLYKAGGQVRLAQEQVNKEETENQRLKQHLAEIDTPEFIEREAREKLGYAREGETILILPDQNASSKSQTPNPIDDRPNWKKWWDLYIGL